MPASGHRVAVMESVPVPASEVHDSSLTSSIDFLTSSTGVQCRISTESLANLSASSDMSAFGAQSSPFPESVSSDSLDTMSYRSCSEEREGCSSPFTPSLPTAQLMTAADCSICCEQMRDPVVGGGCTHHFCEECLVRWLDQGKTTCPTCRSPITAVMRDVEFALLARCPMSPAAGALQPKSLQHAREPERRLDVRVRPPTGLVLANSPMGHGCIVIKLDRHMGAARARIQVGDVVTAVNGIAIKDHQEACKAIERAGRHGGARLDRADACPLRVRPCTC